jgi:hypothetical protein
VRAVRYKRCKSCGVEFVASKRNFYRCKTNADGFMGDCKECTKRAVYENRELKADYYRAYDRQRNHRPERRAAISAWKRSPAGRQSAARSNRVYKRFRALEARA